jgi:hypothetical protein
MGEDGNGAKLRVAVNSIAEGRATAAKMVSPNHWRFAIIVAVKSVTIAINDLFEFEDQPVPAQRLVISEIKQAKREGARVLKVIHGYGSSGKCERSLV